MPKHETYHRDGSGGVTKVVERNHSDGSSDITVLEGSKDIFGIYSGRIVSETHVTPSGDSYTKRR